MFVISTCTAHCCSMRCTRSIHSHTRIYRCKIALLTPTSWDTLYAYKAQTHGRGRGQLQLIVRLKVDRTNEENAERGRVIQAKSEKALWRATPSKKPAFRFCPRSFSPRWGSAYLALRQRRRRHRASSAAAPNTSLCSICFQYHLNNDAEHNNQIDVRRIVKTCTHTHSHTHVHVHTYLFTEPARYLPSNSIWLRINPSILFLYIPEHLVFEFMNIWKCCAVNESEFHYSESRIVISYFHNMFMYSMQNGNCNQCR